MEKRLRSRALREGSVGLLILVGIGLFVGLALWLRGIQVGARSYTLVVKLPDALGIDVGSPVKYRGVRVGTITSIQATPNGVELGVEIARSQTLIPREVLAEASQSGFIGQVTLDLRPQKLLATGAVTENLKPFGDACNRQLILCDGDRIEGQVGVSFDELIRATTQIANLLNNSEVVKNANDTLKNLSTAALGVNQLSKDARVQLQNFGTAAESVTQAAEKVGSLGDRFGSTADRFNLTADRITNAADQVTSLVQDNRGTLVTTLENMNEASSELKTAINGLSPFISKLDKSKILENLETLSANGADAATNLKNLTGTLNSPVAVLGLAQTLDAARATFVNTQRITTNLDRITNKPEFQENLERLIKGLSKLVSSSETLEQQLQAVSEVMPPAPAPSAVSPTLAPVPSAPPPTTRARSLTDQPASPPIE